MACDAWQYNAAAPIACIFHIRARLMRLVPMVARDTDGREHERMLVRVSTCALWLTDAVMNSTSANCPPFPTPPCSLAPSMLLGYNTTWIVVDDGAFDIRLTDGPRSVMARVSIDGRGALRPQIAPAPATCCHPGARCNHPIRASNERERAEKVDCLGPMDSDGVGMSQQCHALECASGPPEVTG